MVGGKRLRLRLAALLRSVIVRSLLLAEVNISSIGSILALRACMHAYPSNLRLEFPGLNELARKYRNN